MTFSISSLVSARDSHIKPYSEAPQCIVMHRDCLFVCLMVFSATFNNISAISWRSVLLVEESGGPGENHRPVASHWQNLSHYQMLYNSPWSRFELTTSVVIGIDCIGTFFVVVNPTTIWPRWPQFMIRTSGILITVLCWQNYSIFSHLKYC